MYQFFAPRSSSKSPVRLPENYRETVRWHPRLGDAFPFCTFNTSAGVRSLADLAGTNWIYFFSLPQAFTPVCTAELANFARHHAAFRASGITLVAFSQSTIQRQRDWHDMIQQQMRVTVDIPFIEDPDLALAKCFGMVHPREDKERMIRKSFVLDPQHVIRSLVEYPAGLMRNAAEALVHVKNLQEIDNPLRRIPTGQDLRGGVMQLQNPADPIVPKRVASKPVFGGNLA